MPLESIRDYWRALWNARRQAIWIIGGGTVLSAALAFLWPPSYTARCTLLPPTEEETGYSVSSLIRGISLPGVRFPSRTGPEEVALSVLESRRIKGGLVDRFALMDHYGKSTRNKAIRALEENSGSRIDENGLIVIEVTDSDAKKAAELANAYAEELDRFNRDVRMTRGRRTRLFIEQRIDETRKEMSEAEQKLEEYQSKHSTVALSPEQMSTIESGARLLARQANLRIQVGLAKEYASAQSEEVRVLQRELNEVNRQVASLPDMGLALARMMRDLKIQEQVYALLSAQYEEARINESRDIATLEVLDNAEAPDRPSWPRRGLLIGLGFLVSAGAYMTWVILRSNLLR